MMRVFRNIIPLAALWFFFPSVLSAGDAGDGKDVSYLGEIRFEDRSVEKAGRDVTLSMGIVLDSAKIKTQHTVSLTPVLVSADRSREFPFGTVIIDGRVRHNVIMRRETLNDSISGGRDSALSIIVRKNRSAQEYAYLSTIPYSSWMLEGKLEMRESVTGCADCGEGDSVVVLASPVLPRFVPQWKRSFSI